MKSTALFALSALCLAVPALAQLDAGTPPATAQNAPLPQKSHLAPTGGTGYLKIARRIFFSGQPVPVQFVVVNKTKKALYYDFSTGQQFDLTARNGQGKTVWTWSKGRVFPMMLTSLKLAPGQSQVYDALWNGCDDAGKPVPAGAYTLAARMTSNNRPAITGGVVVNPDTDPNNLGTPTRSPAETGAVRQVYPNPPVTASAKIVLHAPGK